MSVGSVPRPCGSGFVMAFTVRPDLWPLGMFARIAGGPAGSGYRLASRSINYHHAQLSHRTAVVKGYADPGVLEAQVLAGADVWAVSNEDPNRPDIDWGRGPREDPWPGL